MHHHIQHLHLDIGFHPSFIGLDPSFDTKPSAWRAFFAEQLHTQMPNLRSLDLEIEFEGLVSCWRKAQGREFTDMFRPFQRLPLRAVTVVVYERLADHPGGRMYYCVQEVHDERLHALPFSHSFEERRNAKLKWAEEIRAVILGENIEMR